MSGLSGVAAMITFSVARTKQVLWIEFGLPISEQTYLRLDEERAAILRREGPMDLIVDFTAASAAVFPSELAHQRALVPSPVPGHRRVFTVTRSVPQRCRRKTMRPRRAAAMEGCPASVAPSWAT